MADACHRQDRNKCCLQPRTKIPNITAPVSVIYEEEERRKEIERCRLLQFEIQYSDFGTSALNLPTHRPAVNRSNDCTLYCCKALKSELFVY